MNLKKLKISTICVALLAILGLSLGTCSTASAQTGKNLVKNGSFDNPTGHPGASTITETKGSHIGAWLVTKGNVTLVRDTVWKSHSGLFSLELAGYAPGTGTPSRGSISQNVKTKAGQAYAVSFWIAGNPFGGPKTKIGAVSFAGVTNTFSFTNTAATTATNMGWKHVQFVITALSNLSTLTFSGHTHGPGGYGIVIDDVKVMAVPEASTMFGFGTVLLLGFIMLRKKRQMMSTLPI